MAILKVAQMGHPVLRQVAAPVRRADLASPRVQQLIDDLFETMDAYDGAGLAAPQVHVPLRIVVLTFDEDTGPEVLVNPVIRPLSDVSVQTLEGCLSVEGLRGIVERPGHVQVDFLDRHGHPHRYELTGFPAVVVQHECDHLDGVLYLDRAVPRSLAFVDELMRHGPPMSPARSDLDDTLTPLPVSDA